MKAGARVVIYASRALFCVALVLACLTPSWQHGAFALWPLGTVRLLGHDYAPGALMLAPLAVAVTWLWGTLAGQRWRHWARPAWWAVGPALGLGTLALVRVWPVHVARAAFVTVTSIGFFWAIGLFAHTELPIRYLAAAMAAVLVLQGLVAVGQFALQGPVGLEALGEAAKAPSEQGAYVLVVGGRRWLRAQGMAPHPNVLGGQMTMGLLMVAGRAQATRDRVERALLLGSMAPGMAGLLLSFSRSALLALLLSMAGCGLVLRRAYWGELQPAMRRWLLGGLGACILLLGAALSLRLCGLGNLLEQNSLRERLEDYRLAWTLIRARPWLGVGSGYYVRALWATVGSQMGPKFPGFRTVHSIPLLAAAELGVGGALLWMALLVGPAFVGLHRGATGHDWELVGLCVALLAGFLATLVDVYLYLPVAWWPALILGAMLGAWSRHGSQGCDDVRR